MYKTPTIVYNGVKTEIGIFTSGISGVSAARELTHACVTLYKNLLVTHCYRMEGY